MKGWRESQRRENIFEEKRAENFLNLVKTIKPQTQQSQRTPNKKHKENSANAHVQNNRDLN